MDNGLFNNPGRFTSLSSHKQCIFLMNLWATLKPGPQTEGLKVSEGSGKHRNRWSNAETE